MRGKKFSGKVILPSKTLYVDVKDGYKFKKFSDLPPDYPAMMRSNLKPKSIFGMYWIGIYPFYSIYERRQQWLEWKSFDDGKRKIIFRDEMTPYLIVKPFEYAMLLEEGEDKMGMPLNISFTVTLQPTDALLPIFGNDNAYGQVQTKCLAEVLLFTKEKTFTNLGGDNVTSDIKNDEFSLLLCKLNETIPGKPKGQGVESILGYTIEDAKLDKIEITGDNKDKLLNLSTLYYETDEKAKATEREAEARMHATEFDAKGKKANLDVELEFLKGLTYLPPSVVKVQERKATPNLTTLVVEGDANKPSIIIGGGK